MKRKPSSRTARLARRTTPESVRLTDPRKLGADRRKQIARSDLAAWDAELRHLTVDALLERSMHDRVPALAKIKNQRMAASPFGFFRGAAPVMAYDLSRLPSTGIIAQLCGDAHVENLGAYTGPDGRLIFDINDFDETIHGPFEWDVKRMATSILLAGADAKLKDSDSVLAAHLCLNAYTALMRKFARMPVLEMARYQVHRLGAIAPISKILAKAERATPRISVEKLTERHDAGRRFKDTPPLLRRVTGEEAANVLGSLAMYAQTLLPERRHFLAQFRPVDVAFKVVGTGSVGLRDYCVYLEGIGSARHGVVQYGTDPLFLQIKQEVRSTYAEYLPDAVTPDQEGRRVAEGQRAMQLQSDPMLGWTSIAGRDYLVRQLNDHKAGVDITKLKAADLAQYAAVCGELLARGHARSGDARLISGYLGNGVRFREAIVEFAGDYAVQTRKDWKQFRQAHADPS